MRTTPILLAVTPLPSPLTTPPVTSTYFIFEIVLTETGAVDLKVNLPNVCFNVQAGKVKMVSVKQGLTAVESPPVKKGLEGQTRFFSE